MQSIMNKKTSMMTDNIFKPTYMWRTLGVDILK